MPGLPLITFIWLNIPYIVPVLLLGLLIAIICAVSIKKKSKDSDGERKKKLKRCKNAIIALSVSVFACAAYYAVPFVVIAVDNAAKEGYMVTTKKLTKTESVKIGFVYNEEGNDFFRINTISGDREKTVAIIKCKDMKVSPYEITKARYRKSNEWKKVELLREEEDGTKVYSLLWNEYRLYLYPSGEMEVKPTT